MKWNYYYFFKGKIYYFWTILVLDFQKLSLSDNDIFLSRFTFTKHGIKEFWIKEIIGLCNALFFKAVLYSEICWYLAFILSSNPSSKTCKENKLRLKILRQIIYWKLSVKLWKIIFEIRVLVNNVIKLIENISTLYI